MGAVIAVVNQKGGVAKTTTTINLAWALAELGHACLMVDSDPQASLTIHCGIDPDSTVGASLYEALVIPEGHERHQVLTPRPLDMPRLALVPSNLDLAAAELELNAQAGREYALSRVLALWRDRYAFTFIDCPPTLGILTVNALAAADAVLIPVATNYLSLRGLQLLLRSVCLVQGRLNTGLRILGILATQYDRRMTHHQEVLQELRRIFAPQHIRVFEAVIARSVRFEESPLTARAAVAYAPNIPGAHAYRQLAEEVLALYATPEAP